MMVKAKGPVWHKKQKEAGIIPEGLRGLDQEATWSFSQADRWVYGHGTFSIVAHDIPVLGMFTHMVNSASEAKLMGRRIRFFKDQIENVCMDSKADDSALEYSLRQFSNINLITKLRNIPCVTEMRIKFKERMEREDLKEIYKMRGITVEPVQGLMSDIFGLERCWMRGDENNRWLFAAMGVAVQMAQLEAWRNNLSVWKIKDQVLGL